MASGPDRRTDGEITAQTLGRRITALKIRTGLTAVSALLCGFLGGWLGATPLGKLIGWGYGAVLDHSGMPLLHVPIMQPTGLLQTLPATTFLGICILALAGYSAGFFGRLSLKVVIIPPLLAGLASVAFLPSTARWIGVLPSKLERAIMRDGFDQAEQMLKQARLQDFEKQYVLAQIALRARDDRGLRKYGAPLLQFVDQISYGANTDETSLRAAMRLHPEVIHAVDIAINQEPQTHVGIKWQQDNQGSSAFWRWLADAVLLAVAALLIGLSLALFMLWNQMRLRITVLLTGIGAGKASIADEQYRWEASRQTVVIPGSVRPAVVLGLMVSGLIIVLGLMSGRLSAPSLLLGDRADGAQPCQFIGTWRTRTYDGGTYDVTLMESGKFVGRAGSSTDLPSSTGSWGVHDNKIEWVYSGARGGSALNEIRNVSAQSFDLVEYGDVISHYTLTGGRPDCKR